MLLKHIPQLIENRYETESCAEKKFCSIFERAQRWDSVTLAIVTIAKRSEANVVFCKPFLKFRFVIILHSPSFPSIDEETFANLHIRRHLNYRTCIRV